VVALVVLVAQEAVVELILLAQPIQAVAVAAEMLVLMALVRLVALAL
jgi:hypothetical protein